MKSATADGSAPRRDVEASGVRSVGGVCIVKHHVQLLSMGAPAPDWRAVLSGREDQCLGGDV